MQRAFQTTCTTSRRGLRILALLAATGLTVGSETPLQANGGTSHIIVGLEARNRVRSKALKTILEKHRTAFTIGVVHPDVYRHVRPLAVECGENGNQKCTGDGHIDPDRPDKNWINAYFELIEEREPGENLGIQKAFLYGAIAHIVNDAHFDPSFVNPTSSHDTIANRCVIREPDDDIRERGPWEAGFHSDIELDICLAGKLQGKRVYDGKIRRFCNNIGNLDAFVNRWGDIYLLEADKARVRNMALQAYERAGIPIQKRKSLNQESAEIWGDAPTGTLIPRALKLLPKTPTKSLNGIWERWSEKDADNNDEWQPADRPSGKCAFSRLQFRRSLEEEADLAGYFIRKTDDAIKRMREGEGRHSHPHQDQQSTGRSETGADARADRHGR